jgi:hypothetical protein
MRVHNSRFGVNEGQCRRPRGPQARRFRFGVGDRAESAEADGRAASRQPGSRLPLGGYFTSATCGGFQLPSRMDGGFSLGQ